MLSHIYERIYCLLLLTCPSKYTHLPHHLLLHYHLSLFVALLNFMISQSPQFLCFTTHSKHPFETCPVLSHLTIIIIKSRFCSRFFSSGWGLLYLKKFQTNQPAKIITYLSKPHSTREPQTLKCLAPHRNEYWFWFHVLKKKRYIAITVFVFNWLNTTWKLVLQSTFYLSLLKHAMIWMNMRPRLWKA